MKIITHIQSRKKYFDINMQNLIIIYKKNLKSKICTKKKCNKFSTIITEIC